MQYEDFFRDFPTRCFDVFTAAVPLVRSDGHEITLLLCVMAASLTIPRERLRPVTPPNGEADRANPRTYHPSGDALHHARAASCYDELMRQPFLRSLGAETGDSWQKGDVSLEWGEKQWMRSLPQDKMSEKEAVEGVLSVIRNGLAHGNIWIDAGPGEIITRIVFLSTGNPPREGRPSGEPVKFKYVSVSVEGLIAFVRNWLNFLNRLPFEPVSR